MAKWRSPHFYGSLFVGSAVTFIFVSLGVAIFGGDDPWPTAVVWAVNIAMWVLSLAAGYAHAVAQFKKRAIQHGFSVMLKPPGGPEAGAD